MDIVIFSCRHCLNVTELQLQVWRYAESVVMSWLKVSSRSSFQKSATMPNLLNQLSIYRPLSRANLLFQIQKNTVTLHLTYSMNNFCTK